MLKKLLPLLALLASIPVFGQNTVGLISYRPTAAFEGYNLIYPHDQPHVYLLNNCGEIVHVWQDEPVYRPGNTAYILPDGRLVRAKRLSNVSMDPIWAGGGGAIIEIRDWDNNLLFSFEMNNALHRLHHDFAVTPQGTIIAVAWEKKTQEEAIQAGRNTALLPDGELWSEALFEIDPATGAIVWEWHLWDHLVQDFDPAKDNFGIVENRPERLDINFTTNAGARNWLHTNAVDFNDELNQIMLSSPFLNEIYIIDHSTTTAQAATSNGGLGGRGGDFLFRWGNPQAYRRGTAADQTLFFNHDAHWIDDHLNAAHPHFGKIGVFNNLAGPDFSTVEVVEPDWDMYTWNYPIPAAAPWGPTAPQLTLTHPEPTAMYSTGLSSAQFLPNGNVLIHSGRQGYAFELTPDNQLAWEYVVPLKNGQPVSQGTNLVLNDNLTFRMDRYPATYSAFNGKDLSPKGWLELEPDSTFCNKILSTGERPNRYRLTVAPNPAKGQVTLQWEGSNEATLQVFDWTGRAVTGQARFGSGRTSLDISGWQSGIYFIKSDKWEPVKLVVMK